MKDFLLSFGFQLLISYVSTVAFSLIFQIPKKYLPISGIPGALGWLAFYFLKPVAGLALSMLAGAIVMTLTARILAVILLCPFTVFLVSGMMPLVPGSAVFLTVYHLLRREFEASGENALETLLTCGAILLGIAIVSVIPQKALNVLKPKKRR